MDLKNPNINDKLFKLIKTIVKRKVSTDVSTLRFIVYRGVAVGPSGALNSYHA